MGSVPSRHSGSTVATASSTGTGSIWTTRSSRSPWKRRRSDRPRGPARRSTASSAEHEHPRGRVAVVIDERFVRRAERIVRDLAARLGSPRDEALMTAAEAGYALLTGHRVRGGMSATHREPRIDRIAFKLAERAFDSGDFAGALRRLDTLAAAYPTSLRILRLRRDVQSHQGELTAQAHTLHRMHRLDDSPERHATERLLLGR